MNFVAPEPTPQDLLVSSIQHGTMDGIQDWLTNRGVDALEAVKFGESEMNVLHIACFYGNLQAVVKLLEYFPIDKPTKGGNTCCHLAAMNGHAAVVDVLIERGASPGAKNLRGQNVFDVANGLQLRQTLMTLVLAEEQRNGTAPVIAGVTRDMTAEQARLKNLPPPPTSFGPVPTTTASAGLNAQPQHQQQQQFMHPQPGFPSNMQQFSSPSIQPPLPSSSYPQARAFPPQQTLSSRPIQPDGFVTTVGNPNLAAKYGNQTQSRLAPDSTVNNMNQEPPSQQAWTPPTISNAPQINANARYVVNTPGFNVLPPSRPPQATNHQSFRPPSGPYANRVKVFNPAAASPVTTEAEAVVVATTTTASFPGGQQQSAPSGFQQ